MNFFMQANVKVGDILGIHAVERVHACISPSLMHEVSNDQSVQSIIIIFTTEVTKRKAPPPSPSLA